MISAGVITPATKTTNGRTPPGGRPPYLPLAQPFLRPPACFSLPLAGLRFDHIRLSTLAQERLVGWTVGRIGTRRGRLPGIHNIGRLVSENVASGHSGE